MTVSQVCQIALVTNALGDMVKSFMSQGEQVTHTLREIAILNLSFLLMHF